jgi:hypothetical protein
MFSPPNTPVVIHGDTVGKGFAVEIEDRGLGMSDEQFARVNSLLENPPPFDPSSSDQLGLFVAGQLAKRHDIKISLRPSPYGGTTAIVLIPQSLVVPEGSHAKDPAAALGEGTLRFKARHALDWAGGDGTGEAPVSASAVTSWTGADIPAMRDPADTADLTPASRAAPALPGPGLGADDFGLPRRVRQASLAPQLRDPAAEPDPAQGSDDFWARSPEETRSTMTAIQQGWERGRSVFDVPVAGAGTSAAPESAAEAGRGATMPGPDAAGAPGPEPATEDRGTSG